MGVFKILGEMAKWANNSLDKQTRSINDESVTGLDVFASLCAHCKGRANGLSHELFSLLSLSFLPSVIGH